MVTSLAEKWIFLRNVSLTRTYSKMNLLQNIFSSCCRCCCSNVQPHTFFIQWKNLFVPEEMKMHLDIAAYPFFPLKLSCFLWLSWKRCRSLFLYIAMYFSNAMKMATRRSYGKQHLYLISVSFYFLFYSLQWR